MDDTGFGLYELLFDRVAADPTLTSRCADLVVAALDGEDALHAVLAGEAPPPTRSETAVSRPDGPSGIYLRSIRAKGFRGVGPAATLDLQPGPGLTVVTGRNGSGKSTFAEAAELALSGENSRWTAKQNNKALWTGGWRNLHAVGPTEIEVDLVVAGHPGSTTVRTSWDEGQELTDAAWTVQHHGAKRQPVSRGWLPGLTLYRPFLSYGELGALIDKRPSELHDALHSLLGLGVLDAARDRLRAARVHLETRKKAVEEAKHRLLAELATVDDQRARHAEEVLRPAEPDLDALGDLLLDQDTDLTAIDGLRDLTTIALPTSDEVTAAAARIRRAGQRVADASTARALSASAVADLLQAALDHHAAHGDGPCPVCGTGTVDTAWRDATVAEVERLRGEAADLQAARAEHRTALESATSLVAAPPAVLQHAPGEVDVSALAAAWSAWTDAARTDVDDLPDALLRAHADVVAALSAVQEAARAALVRLDETWRPVASRLWAWHEDASTAARDKSAIADIRTAERWLRTTAADLSNERMAPFATRSQEIWRQLRQQSNVDLGAITLAGSGNQRRLRLDVTVDGTDSAALSVMSQGELHALGLSLFLPRATRDESPFRFVLIDDPVQAMDPAKVDGLARVLSEIARTRQVVVFTHDDRLADAVRRLPEPALVYEVRRRERSEVQVITSTDPISRYLSDARAVIKDAEMPDELRREIVANCCRGALEAAANAKVRRVRLGRGDTHADVEDALAKAPKTHDKVTLAVFDDPRRGGELFPHLDRRVGSWAADTLRACKEGAHQAYRSDLERLVENTRDLIRRVLT
jgi:hypothetical protein